MGRGPGRPRLSEVLAKQVGLEDAKDLGILSEKKVRVITADEATILVKLGMSGADVNDKARRAVTYFLEYLVLKNTIYDNEAKVCLEILRQMATSTQKELCNKVLAKYISKFDFEANKKADAVNEGG